MSSSFTIRKASYTDIPKVIEINLKSLPENYPEFFFYYHLENWGDAFFVAETDGEIVGYIMNRVERGIGNLKKSLIKKGHVVSIAILEGYRGKGIGSALMLSGIEAMKNVYDVKEVYLEVRVSNIPAIKLYEKIGFRKVKVLRGYYSDGEDAYLMAMEL